MFLSEGGEYPKPPRRYSLRLSSKDKAIVCRQYMHMHLCIEKLLGNYSLPEKILNAKLT